MVGMTGQSALKVSARLAAGEVSSVELMRATLDRIAAVNAKVNAIVALRGEDDLMAEAAAADRGPRRGWLHGVPIAVKDLVATKGIVTTWGSPIYQDFVPDEDALVARRLKQAGAILIGKTNVPEFGLGSNTYNTVYGVTRNPYDLTRSCGGSSGGAAVALATGMVPVADGSDMMGSLRNPAAWNNIYGMRPTYGLIPGDNAGASLHPLATSGPMARNPADMAALLETLAGPDQMLCGGAEFVAGDLNADLAGLRIGWLGDWGGAFAMEDGILEISEAALSVLVGLGCNVEPVATPFPAEKIWQSWTALRSWSVADKWGVLIDDTGNDGLLKPELIWEIENGRRLSNADILRANAARADWFVAAAQVFQTYDALVLPSAQVWPFSSDLDWPQVVSGQTMDTYHRWMEVVIAVSLIGLPAVNLPAGFGEQGLPMGVQIFGPRGADGALLRIAHAYHRATNWPGNFPPVL